MSNITRQDALKFITSKVFAMGGRWTSVERRLAKITVDSGCDCGRFIVVNYDGYFFKITEGAYNSHMVIDHDPIHNQVDNAILKVVAEALSDNCKISVTCNGEVDLEQSTNYNDVLESLFACTEVMNVVLTKRVEKGTFSTCMYGLNKDETIIDYTSNKYCNDLYNKVIKQP